MKVTKFVHSCVFVEDKVNVLFDPGVFSWKSGVFKIDEVENIDYIVITHAHPDHFFPEFIQTVINKFPNLTIVASPAVQNMIENAGIDHKFTDSTDEIKPFDVDHRVVEPFAKTVPNTGYNLNDKLTNPGDDNRFNESKEVLLMPIIAPWGTIMEGINKAIDLKPKTVIPIHDWQYSAPAQDWAYNQMKPLFDKAQVQLLVLKDGVAQEI